MLRVLHVLPSVALDRGGPSRSVLGLAQAEADAGASVEFVAGQDSEPAAVSSPGRFLHLGGRHLPVAHEIPGPALAATLWKAIGRADIVHLHSVWNGTVSLAEMMCRVRQVRYVLSPRGMLDAHNMKRRRLLKQAAYLVLERGNLAAVAGWHFLDTTEREGCSWLAPVANAKDVLIAANGVEVAAIQAAAECQTVPFPEGRQGECNLVFLGRIHPIKGLDLALEVIRTLADGGIRCVLHLIGPDDGCLSSVLEQARSLNIADRVRHWGPMYGEGRFAVLRNADAVILTSHYECNSVTAAETMAAGGLLIATDSCHLEVARSAGAAVVVPRERARLADAIREWTTDPVRGAAVRDTARRFAQECLAWPALAGRMIAFYRQVLGDSRCAA